MKLLPVILSGGRGSRLWPLSSSDKPKPFLRIGTEQSFLQAALLRSASLTAVTDVVTVTSDELIEQTLDEYRSLKVIDVQHHLISEPVRNNTGPAVAAALSYTLSKFDPDTILLFLPADHVIDSEQKFLDAVVAAMDMAAAGYITTFGIEPDRPETQYGYIEAEYGRVIGRGFGVAGFHEKPELNYAVEFCAHKNFYWNSGMFCCQAGVLRKQFERYAAQLYKRVSGAYQYAVCSELLGHHLIELNSIYYKKARNISIDYALLEKSDQIAVLPCDMGWSDIGSWQALGGLCDADNNANHYSGELVTHNSNSNFVYSPDKQAALVGVDNLVIVNAESALLVAHKDSIDQLNRVVPHDALPVKGLVKRAWGTYRVLESGVGYKVKQLEIEPGRALSLQRHKHRSEHWVVVSGVASVQHNDLKMTLEINESTFIPAGDLHKLSNMAQEALIIIEVQSGAYLEEDDIERFD